MFLQISGKKQYFMLVIKKFCKCFFVQYKLMCLINATSTLEFMSITYPNTVPYLLNHSLSDSGKPYIYSEIALL